MWAVDWMVVAAVLDVPDHAARAMRGRRRSACLVVAEELAVLPGLDHRALKFGHVWQVPLPAWLSLRSCRCPPVPAHY